MNLLLCSGFLGPYDMVAYLSKLEFYCLNLLLCSGCLGPYDIVA